MARQAETTSGTSDWPFGVGTTPPRVTFDPWGGGDSGGGATREETGGGAVFVLVCNGDGAAGGDHGSGDGEGGKGGAG